MLKSLLISFCITMLTFLSSCDKEDESSEKPDQILTVYLEFNDRYYNEEADSMISGPFTMVSGFLSADPVPKMIDLKVNGRLVFDKFFYSYGLVSFYDETALFGRGLPIPFSNGLQLVTANTALGEITGKISVPAQISSVSFSPASSMTINQPVTVSWKGSNANFYSVAIFYNGVVDTIVKGNTVTFPGKYFKYPGVIDEASIYPVNGPFPVENISGNLSGAGKGNLFYVGKSYDWEGWIVIGSGTEHGTSLKGNDEKRREFRQSLKNKLLGK